MERLPVEIEGHRDCAAALAEELTAVEAKVEAMTEGCSKEREDLTRQQQARLLAVALLMGFSI